MPALFAGLVFVSALLAGGCAGPPGETTGTVPLAATGAADRGEIVKRLLDHYHSWRAVPYRTGGMSRKGIDCSGFVASSYRTLFGLTVPRTTRQLAKSGRKIDPDKLLPGDLVLFKTGWFSRHVGIYLENGTFLHASLSRGVTVSGLREAYWRSRFWQARRILY